MSKEIVPVAEIAQSIHFLRGQKVMLDFDLAALYEIETRALKQAVRRNRGRFPSDFMFEVSPAEVAKLVSQSVIPSASQFGGAQPMAFTEQGVAMLSSVLRSQRAVKVNIAIMRAFVKLRAALETNRELAKKFLELEKRVGGHDSEIAAIIDAIRQLMAPPPKPARQIGFHVQETPPRYGKRKRA
ncbi:MAG: ORF6N domain-containing protein [Spartobacteria bacterium]